MKYISEIPKNHSVQICISGFYLNETQNFYLAIVPNSRVYKGHQWHRDIFPAMRRFITFKVYGSTRRPLPKNKSINYHEDKIRLISSLDCIEPEDYNKFIKNKNKYLWAIYNSEKREMEEVNFN